MLEKCCQVQIKQQIRTQIENGKEGLKWVENSMPQKLPLLLH